LNENSKGDPVVVFIYIIKEWNIDVQMKKRKRKKKRK
jgi:hypothetical protein